MFIDAHLVGATAAATDLLRAYYDFHFGWPELWYVLSFMLLFNSSSSNSSSKSSSGTKFPEKFLNKYREYFGTGDSFNYGGPTFNPQYKGFGNFDDVEKAAYTSQADKLTTAYKDAIARQREELSQAGLLDSPAQYIEGGARDVMNRDYLSSIQQAARDARSQRLGLEESEAGRESQFNFEKARTLANTFLSMFNSVAAAGRYGKSKGSSSSSSFGTNLSFSSGS